MKYDSHGTWESNNYHGLGWSAKNDISNLDGRGSTRQVKFWPTPVKNEDRASAYTLETSRRHFVEGSHQVHLAQAARDPVMYPTPTVSAGGHREPPDRVRHTANGRMESDTGTFRQLDLGQVAKAVVRYPTPVSNDKSAKRPPGRVRLTASGTIESDTGTYTQMSLQQAVNAVDSGMVRKAYPTPIRSDASVSKNRVTLQKVENGEAFNQLSRAVRTGQMKEAGDWESNPDAVRGESEKTVGKRGRVRLPTPTSQNGLRNGNEPGSSGGEHYPGWHAEYGELNPRWVEWIMGWVIGWTSLEPLDPAAFEQWWELMQADPVTGMPRWWLVDPSDVPDSGITKTVVPASKEADEVRMSEVAALGNGQVSAVIPAITHILSNLELPEEGD